MHSHIHSHSQPHRHLHAHVRQVSLGFTPDLYPEGTHICYLYSDDEEHKRFMSEFVFSGIAEGESVTYIADTRPDKLAGVIEALGIPKPPQQNHLAVAPAMETYCPGGHFIPQVMLDRLRDLYVLHPANCTGARGTGEMTWALQEIPGSDRLLEYEGRINDLLAEFPLTVLCQYDTRKFNGAMIFDLLNVHPIMIVHGQIMRNPFYIPRDQSSRWDVDVRNDK